MLERVLRRFPGGSSHYENLRLKLGVLAEPGMAITVVLESHRVGLMRPYLAGEPGPGPYVVCREGRRMLQVPVVCPSLEDARSFARAASQVEGLSLAGWQAFEGERLRSPIEQLFVRRDDGSVGMRSELEEALSAQLAKAKTAAVRPTIKARSRRKQPMRARRTTSSNKAS